MKWPGLLICLFFSCQKEVPAQKEVLVESIPSSNYTIYVEGDWENYSRETEALFKGFALAVYRFTDVHPQKRISLKKLNNLGKRDLRNRLREEILTDKSLLGIIKGYDFPADEKDVKFSREKQVVLLNAGFSSMDGIPEKGEWYYSLSLSDIFMSQLLADYTVNLKDSVRIRIIGYETSKSRRTFEIIKNRYREYNMPDPLFISVPENLNNSQAVEILRHAHHRRTGWVVLLLNPRDTKTFSYVTRDILTEKERIPLLSHLWGFSGEQEGIFIPLTRSRLQISSSPLCIRIQNSFQEMWPNEIYPDFVMPLYSFSHGYDAGLLLVEALSFLSPRSQEIKRIDMNSHMKKLDYSIEGLIKNYMNPFEQSSEALTEEDYIIGYSCQGDISLGI